MFITINNAGMMINVGVNVKNWLIIIIWSPSNCECECVKLCDIGEYLDCLNCKCRKKLVDKLIEECTENIEKTKLNETLAKNEHKCSSCTLYIVLFWIFFIFSVINIGIGTFFTFYKYMSRNKKMFLDMIILVKQQFIELIKWDKSKKLA